MANPSLTSTQAIVEKWRALAAGVAESQPSVPITVLTGEALDLSHFIDQHWEPATGESSRPGMQVALISGLIQESTAEELRELVVAVSHAHAQFRAVTAATLEAPVDRGAFLLSEIKQCLEFIFDDGVNDEQDAELARLSESHTDTSSHDGLALSLEGFAYYADRFREKLAQLPQFDTAMIDEALVVANRLREQSALKMSNDARDKQRLALSLRNRFVTLLTERVSVARRAARFVFRHHPDIARLAGSGHERRQRARRRRAAEADSQPESEATPAQA